jgi:hypothetical protein
MEPHLKKRDQTLLVQVVAVAAGHEPLSSNHLEQSNVEIDKHRRSHTPSKVEPTLTRRYIHVTKLRGGPAAQKIVLSPEEEEQAEIFAHKCSANHRT